MAAERLGLPLILALALAGCSSASRPFSAASEKKGDDEGSGGGNGEVPPEDKEGEEADDPTEVAGAFLVACGTSKVPPKDMPQDGSASPIGCAVVQKESKKKVQGQAQISTVNFSLTDGTTATPALEPVTDAASPWHVLTYLETIRAYLIKDINGNVVIDGSTFDTQANADKELYAPEGPLPEDPAVIPEELNQPGAPLTIAVEAATNGTTEGRKALKGSGTAAWEIATLTDATNHLVIKLQAAFFVTKISFIPCNDSMRFGYRLGQGYDATSGDFVTQNPQAMEPSPVVGLGSLSQIDVVDRTTKSDHVILTVTGAHTCLKEVSIDGFQ